MKKNQPVTLLALAILLSIYGCRVEDLQNVDQPIPESVTQIISSNFPEAENVLIKTVEKDSLWEATYSLNEQDYFLATDSEKIRYNARITHQKIPDKVFESIKNSPISGGTFGNLQIIQRDFFGGLPEFVNYTEYLFHDRLYRVAWLEKSNGFRISLKPYSKILLDGYTHPGSLAKLPPRINQYLTDNYLTLGNFQIRYDNNNRKLYHVIASSATITYWIRFNELLKVEGTDFSPDQVFQSQDEFPVTIQNALQKQTFLNGLSFSVGRRNSTETGIVYGAIFKSNTTGDNFSLEFKSDGTLLWMEYIRY